MPSRKSPAVSSSQRVDSFVCEYRAVAARKLAAAKNMILRSMLGPPDARRILPPRAAIGTIKSILCCRNNEYALKSVLALSSHLAYSRQSGGHMQAHVIVAAL